MLSIGTTTPHNSAILDIESTSQGVLPPRLTTFQRDGIVNPAKGLVLYNITLNCLQVNFGTSATPDWQCMGISPVPTEITTLPDGTELCPFSFDSSTGAITYHQNKSFYEYDSILTKKATDWHSFSIGSNLYLVVANNYDEKYSTYNTPSAIYKWDSTNQQFLLHQYIDTHGAEDWEYFTIGADTFLTVANNRNASNRDINSEVYKWDTGTELFVSHQSILTYGAKDWESFSIGGDTYLVVANNGDGFYYNIDSKIYKWNSGTQLFEVYDSIATNGAIDWEYFIIGLDTFLAVANNYNESTTICDSKVYKWDSGTMQFDSIQGIPTKGAEDIEYFEISGESYIAIANSYSTGSSDPSNINSVIYQWNSGTMQFDSIQGIPTAGASDWEYFTFNGDSFLAVANRYSNISGGYNTNSSIYIWNSGVMQFESHQDIPTIGAYDWEFLTIGTIPFLMVANLGVGGAYVSVDSKLYKWISCE
jgi:hypothetical protein